MVWDGFIFLVLISLCIAGWNVGIINSWRAPIAMIIATIATQQFYVDFATWIVQQLMVKPEWGSFIAYLMMWLGIEITLEVMMNVMLPWGRKERPLAFDRAGGVALAIVRWTIICTLPLMVMQEPSKIPTPPPKDDGLINPIKIGFNDSHLIQMFAGLGKTLRPAFGGIVISDKAPSFKPNFENKKVDLE